MATIGELAYVITAKDSGFTSTLQAADRSMDQASGRMEARGSRLKSTLAQVFTAAAIVAFVRDTVKAGAEYEQALNQFSTVSGATAKEIERAGKASQALGNDLLIPAASALDAATAMEILARGGISATDSIDAARGTLLMAAAAQTNAATAAEMTADALNTFSLEGSQASTVANVLAGAANAATGEVTDFAAGLQQSGSVAASFGMSVGETTTALAAMAQAGIKGSDAGTSLKSMLLALASPTKQQAQALADLGVQAYDANGQFVGMEAVAGQLADAQGRLTQEQFNAAASTAFGTDAMRAAVAMAKQGSSGFADLQAKVTAAGNAQKMAEANSRGMSGALNLLQNAVEDVQLRLFTSEASDAEALIRDIADAIPELADGFLNIASSAGQFVMVGVRGFMTLLQAGTPLLDLVGMLVGAVGDLPGPVLAAGAAMLVLSRNSETVAGWAASLRTAGGDAKAFGSMVVEAYQAGTAAGGGFVGGVKNVTGQMGSLKSVGSGLMTMLGGPLGLALTGATILLSGFADYNAKAASAQRDNASAAQQLHAAIEASNGALDDSVAQAAASAVANAKVQTSFGLLNSEYESMADVASRAGVSQKDLIVAVSQGGDSIEALRQKLLAVAEAEYNWFSGYSEKGDAARHLAAGLAELSGELDGAADSSQATEDAAAELAGELSETGDAAQVAADKLGELQEAADKLSAAQLDANAAQRAYQAAIDDAAASVAQHGATLDINTEAGRANQAALDGIAQAAITNTAAMHANEASIGELAIAQKEARAQIIAAGIAMGMSEDQAAAYADSIYKIPDYATTVITQPGIVGALSDTDRLTAKVVAVPDSKTVVTTALTADSIARLQALGYTVVTLPDGTVQISDNGPNATARIQAVKNAIDSLYDKSVTIATRHLSIYEAQYIGGASKGAGLPSLAEGGLFVGAVQFMAGGGLPGYVGGHRISSRGLSRRLNTGAEIIAPGTMRLMPNGRATGDRLDVPEVYAPLDGSSQMWRMLDRGARTAGGVAMPGRDYAAALATAAAAGAASGTAVVKGGNTTNYHLTVHAEGNSDGDAIGQRIITAMKRHEYLHGTGEAP